MNRPTYFGLFLVLIVAGSAATLLPPPWSGAGVGFLISLAAWLGRVGPRNILEREP